MHDAIRWFKCKLKPPKNCELSLNNSNSETTIYKSAVEFHDESDDEVILNLKGKCVSSSSDEPIDTSDKMLDVENNVNKTITEIRHSVGRDLVSDERTAANQGDEGDQIIQEAEANKARLLPNPGNNNSRIVNWQVNQGASSSVDDNYLVIGSHVDSNLQAKTVNHEYVDFARLLPKDRISKEDDNRLEIINKGGLTYFAPVADREMVGITNFNKWEQAFHIYVNIFTRAFPERASELIQYNHIIYTASLSFAWDNVYTYDCEFRIHLSNYPQRSWSVILQQAWSMYLKDKISHENKYSNVGNGNK